MANNNTNRKRKKSTYKNQKNKMNAFNKKSFSIFVMVISILFIVFLITDKTGSLGRFFRENLLKAFGIMAYFVLIKIFIDFLLIFLEKFKVNFKKLFLISLILLLTMALLSNKYLLLNFKLSQKNILANIGKSGGLLGGIIAFNLKKIIGIVGVWIVYILLWLSLIVNFLPLTYKEFFIRIKDIILFILGKIRDFFLWIKNKFSKEKKDKKKIKDKKDLKIEEKTETISSSVENSSENEDEEDAQINMYTSKQVNFSDFDESFTKEISSYNYPGIDLLETRIDNKKDRSPDIKDKARKIEETLQSFGIKSKIVQINVGPSVTCYELQPARGVKVSRIVNLADDLALSLATSDIRIEAPIPGKSHVGIEVPNTSKEVVGIKEMLASKAFLKNKYQIPFVLGKSISGENLVSAIEKMPHLLVSGATGSGKSVCINTIIMSILYKNSPSEVKLLLIDPKIVELSIYNGIPHLIMPVITDPKKASSSLFWAVREMERRYKLFEENHVRDISSYRNYSDMDDKLEKLPYIVVIIDELSDLMMTAASEVEDYIIRLAQKSRACGIHLIIATQRPTVDVITGIIKANIPSRIAFAVTSQIDSRTILDMAGAEKLLGKGDMLFAPSDAMKPIRIQGAFVSDSEVLKVVNFIKEKSNSEYDQEAIETVEEKTIQVDNNDEEDELIDQAIKIIINENTASVSLLQRKLKIGYARAGRIIDQLEQKGIVGGYEGSKPRRVLVDRSYFEGE